MAVIIISAVLSFAAALLALLAAAGKLPGGGFAAESAASDKNLYRRQMREISRQAGLGLLDAAAAAEARLELARRILSSERAAGQMLPAGEGAERRRGFLLILSAAILAIPLLSGLIYYYQDRPYAPEYSFAEFMARNPQGMSLPEQIVRLEALTARQPQNGAEADALAALYLQAGRFQDAANGYNRAIALNGDNAARQLGYALALTGFNGGVVNGEAEAAFRAVLRLDPHNLEAQLFLARGLIQAGKKQQAETLLRGFLAALPADAPQRVDLERAIAVLREGAAKAESGKAESGAAAQGGAADLTEQQRQFILANLGRLKAKIQAAPQDLEGWAMLLNAYMLLGREEQARQALAQAIAALPADKAQALLAAAKARGLAPAAAQAPAAGPAAAAK